MTPAEEIVLLGQRSRELQDTLASSNLTLGELILAEKQCVDIHKAVCSVLVWIAREEMRVSKEFDLKESKNE